MYFSCPLPARPKATGKLNHGELAVAILEKTRGDRHAQTPIIRAKLKALRQMLEVAPPKDIGEALAINIVAGFALELSLKIFYMTFRDIAPPASHNLNTLWRNFPIEWREEVDQNYRKDNKIRENIYLFAIQRAEFAPEAPRDHTIIGMGTADGLFMAISDTFTYARYFYEKVDVGEWAHVTTPLHQMRVMIDVLSSLYDHLLRVSAAASMNAAGNIANSDGTSTSQA